MTNKNTLSDNAYVYKSYRAAVEILHITVEKRNQINFRHHVLSTIIIIKTSSVAISLIIDKVRFIIQVMTMPQLALVITDEKFES